MPQDVNPIIDRLVETFPACSQAKLELNSRDDIPQILGGLQYLFLNPALLEQIWSCKFSGPVNFPVMARAGSARLGRHPHPTH
jgi:hypothetical protein